jgi:large subunit ribosomal protein L3
MAIALVGQKLGMTRLLSDDGSASAVSVIKIEPNRVVQKKTTDTDGYNAVQITTGAKINRKGQAKFGRISGALKGHYAKASQDIGLGLWEIRTNETELAEMSALDVSIFGAGHFVNVTGQSKGKGFQGGVKRHNFSMQDATHGNSISHRALGSTGQCQTPGRVFKGKKMAGQMGNEQVTEECLEILRVDSERNLLLIKGAIPGAKNGFVKVILSDKKNSVNSQISKQLAEEKAAKVQEMEAAEEALVEEAPAEEAPAQEAPVEAVAEEAPVETIIEGEPVETESEEIENKETESEEIENKADEKETEEK